MCAGREKNSPPGGLWETGGAEDGGQGGVGLPWKLTLRWSLAHRVPPGEVGGLIKRQHSIHMKLLIQREFFSLLSSDGPHMMLAPK